MSAWSALGWYLLGAASGVIAIVAWAFFVPDGPSDDEDDQPRR